MGSLMDVDSKGFCIESGLNHSGSTRHFVFIVGQKEKEIPSSSELMIF